MAVDALTSDEQKAIADAVAALPRSLLDKTIQTAIETAMVEMQTSAPAIVQDALKSAIASQVADLLATKYQAQIASLVVDQVSATMSKLAK